MSRKKNAIYLTIAFVVVAGLLFGATWKNWHHESTVDVPTTSDLASVPTHTDSNSTQRPTSPPKGKSPSEKAGDNARFERSENLLPLVEEMEGRSDVGALTIQARAAEECRLAAVSPNYFAAVDTNGEELYGDKLPFVKAYVSKYLARCGDLAQFKKQKTAETMQAIHRAADAGSPWARAELFDATARNLDSAQADALLRDILASKDPDAIGALADVMGTSRLNSQYSDLSGTPLHSYAWQLASCDLGRDCSANGALMRQMCIFGGTCSSSATYRDFLQQSALSADDFSKVQQIEQQILGVIGGLN